MSTLTVTLDSAALDALDGLAKRTGRSRETVAAQAIEAYVTQSDWQIAKIETNLEAADVGDFASDEETERVGAKFDAVIRLRVQEALDNPKAPLTHEQVFGDLRAHHAARMKAAKRGA